MAGVYISYPFCAQKCTYCNFASDVFPRDLEPQYLDALREELTAIEWPDDELAVFAALKGPLFALGDDALVLFRERHGRLHPLRRRPEALLTLEFVPHRKQY